MMVAQSVALASVFCITDLLTGIAPKSNATNRAIVARPPFVTLAPTIRVAPSVALASGLCVTDLLTSMAVKPVITM